MNLVYAISILFALAPLLVAILHITVGMVWRADFLLGRIDSVRSLVEEDQSPGSRNMYSQLVELFNHVKGFASDGKVEQMRDFYAVYPAWSREDKDRRGKLFGKGNGWRRKFRETSRYWLPAIFLCLIYFAGFSIGIDRMKCSNIENQKATASQTTAPAHPQMEACNAFPWITLVDPSQGAERNAYDAMLFAFLGSFVFNTGIMVRRVFVWDISGQMFWWAVYRTVLSVGLAYVLYYSTNQIDPRYFFLISTASVSILDSASRSLRAKLFQSDNVPKQADLNLQLVQGIDFWKEQRLMEEGVESVQHLATSDFVLLALHTRSPLFTIMDWVDQSIFIQRFPGKVGKLADTGLPSSAVELTWSWTQLLLQFPSETPPDPGKPPQRGGRYEFLEQLEDATNIKQPMWERILRAWSVDNQISLLTLFWRADLGDHPSPPPPPPPPPAPSPASTTESEQPLAAAPSLPVVPETAEPPQQGLDTAIDKTEPTQSESTQQGATPESSTAAPSAFEGNAGTNASEETDTAPSKPSDEDAKDSAGAGDPDGKP